jgi:uncharacterized protein (DUF849 family)
MKRKVIITCAVTGGSEYGKNSTYVPKTPRHIAEEAVAAARAGAASVHIHVRDPETGAPSMEFEHYREVVQRIRDSGVDMLINLTTGMGARYDPPVEDGAPAASVVQSPTARTIHVSRLCPDICTLDVATMNFGPNAVVNTPAHLRIMSGQIQEAGTKPELEVFDLGHVDLALRMIADGHLPEPPFFQFCLGIPGGAPATPEAMLMMRSMLPPDTVWSAFGIARSQMKMVAQSVILGGHCRVGLEDNLYLEHGVLSKGNAPLVERAVAIVESLGEAVATVDEARRILSLPDRATATAA